MITCFLEYTIDSEKIQEFEHYGRLWIDLVNTMGGEHHGYLIPHEGPSDTAYASFSFPTLADYEIFRNNIPGCAKCQAAIRYMRKNKMIIRYDRKFFRPVQQGYHQ